MNKHINTQIFLKLQETSTHSSKDEMQKLFHKNGSVRKVLIDKGLGFENKSISDSTNNKKIFSLVEFENILINYIGVTNRIISTQYPEMENHLIKIIDIIDKEL